MIISHHFHAARQVLILLLLALVALPGRAQSDVSGSKDHPLITRYPGSAIRWYEEKHFAPYQIAVGPVTGYRHIDDWVEVEGKVTRIYYSIRNGRTMTEVYRNYLSALKQDGFEVLAKGLHPERNVNKSVGGGTWLGVHYAKNDFPTNSGVRLLQGSSDAGGTCFAAAKLSTANGTAYIVIGGHKYRTDEVVFMVDVIEVEAMEDGLVSVDAQAMGQSLDRDGKVALYGIYFDVNSARLRPESKPTLDEIAKLLQARTALKLYVVGHTSMEGALAHNMELSEARAKAVVQALTTDYGIAGSRLSGKGVGPLAPEAGNGDEEGRKRNRRVELVAWR